MYLSINFEKMCEKIYASRNLLFITNNKVILTINTNRQSSYVRTERQRSLGNRILFYPLGTEP